MSARADAVNRAALGWVKPELDASLRRVREELEAFAEAPIDIGRMEFCVGYLHQVQGTLRMLELYAAAMVAEELELLARAVQVGRMAARDEACVLLMRGAVLLPDYLERLQDGHRDIPIVLLPLLNEIRAARGESALSAQVLLALDPTASAATPAEIEHARGSLSGRNRELLDTVANALKEELLRVKDALDLYLRTNGEAGTLQPQVAELGAIADTLGILGLGAARDLIVQQREALSRIVAGQQVADESELLDIAGALLYVDASLDEQVANLGNGGDEQAAGASATEFRHTVETLAHEAIVNFDAACEQFVAFIESHWEHARLAGVPQLLNDVGGALRVLGLARPAEYLQGVCRYIQCELIDRQRVPGARQLDTLADAMASLEYYLEALREHRPGREEILDITCSSLEMLHYWPLPEPSSAAAAVETETETETEIETEIEIEIEIEAEIETEIEATAIEPACTAAVQWPQPAMAAQRTPLVESTADPVTRPEAEAMGADSVAGGQQAAPTCDEIDWRSFDAIATHVDVEPLTSPPKSDPSASAPDEALPARELDVTPMAGAGPRLLLAPPQTTSDPEAAASAQTDLGAAAIDPDHAMPVPPTEPDPAVAEPASAGASLHQSQLGFEDDGGDIDDDIRAVFLEELDEELANLGRLLPLWRAAPADSENLRPIRRVFHTLKGSGHLVGAHALGEFSWKIESMLNRVLDHSRAASPAVLAMVEQAYAVLPQLAAALRHGTPIQADLAAMQMLAEQIGAGEELLPPPPAPPETVAVVTADGGGGTPAFVDGVLREILEAEVATHLETVHAWLQSSQLEPQPATEPLLRALHTMGGAFAMTDVPEITAVTAPAESYIKRTLAAAATPTREGVTAIAAVAAAIATTITALQAEVPRIPSFAALAADLRTLTESLPEAQWPPQDFYDELEADAALPLSESDQELTGVQDLSVYLDTVVPAEDATPPVTDSAGQQQPAVEPVSADAESGVAASALNAPVLVAIPAASIVAESDDLGPLDLRQVDGELVDNFVEEGKDLLDHCETLLASLQETREASEPLVGLQRDLHTLKGGARMAGINAIGDLAHSIESLLEAIAGERTVLEREDIGLLERGFDRLHRLLVKTGERLAVAMPMALIEAFKLRTDAHGQNLSTVAPRPRPLAEAEAPEPSAPQADREVLPCVQREQVRVRADLLDRLVNQAGEVAIYRARLEQQLGAFRGAMGELDRTNVRLRDQLRRLDVETEAQIVARYQREQESGEHDFDPLELDRFSNLQQLSRALNESAADLAGLQNLLDELARQHDNLLQQQSRVSSELQDGLMCARMVPFEGLVPRLRRVVRQAAEETGRQVQLVLEGTHGELDRNVLDRMVAPLEHMLRNAVAHGLETPQARREAGKPEAGTIALRLHREGSEIVLEVADDGAGLNRAAIRRRGEQRGLIAPGQPLEQSELDQLIFATGFSTSEQVSQLAGRGVGLDVVRNEVHQLGGSVEVRSLDGQGTTFILRLAQTLAVTHAVFVQIGETSFAVPVASVSGIGRITAARYASGEGGYRYADEDYLLYDLGTLLGQAPVVVNSATQVPLLLLRSGELRAAVAIEQVLGNREIVVKPVGPQIASVPGIYGATITGDGRVVLILDVAPLVRRHVGQRTRPSLESVGVRQPALPLVMVVDDSLTMRKVTGRVLERHNLDVVAARDGVEALEKLAERVPDLMLLDIEMPRMDGYELAAAMRADDRFKAVPIVMITSRSGDKHRQRALQLGVQRYLGKPYQELDLMRNVYDLLGIARVRD